MPIMAVQDQTDARGSARVLAKTTKRCVDLELQPREHVVALNNFFRLLRAYQTHRFAGYAYEPRSPRGPEALTLMPTVDRNVVELGAALHSALAETYEGKQESDALDSVAGVLRLIAAPDPDKQPTEEERARASRFIQAFVNHL